MAYGSGARGAHDQPAASELLRVDPETYGGEFRDAETSELSFFFERMETIANHLQRVMLALALKLRNSSK